MAATEPEDGEREPEPFSPSVFLDLPQTPPGDDGDDDRLLTDDLVLPYISRMLMEEDMDDDRFFYQYPDHPALLQAEQSFADILCGSYSAATDRSGKTFTDSPSSSSSCYVDIDVVPAFATATWPYDPVELTQRLLTAGAANSASSSLRGIEQAESQFQNQNRVSMDMINQAFLKGMEEANKFLPLPTTSISRGRRKNRGHDDLDEEAKTGRKSKVMAPQPEETGEMVDKMVIDGYHLCVNKLKTLGITTTSESTTTEEAAKNNSSSSNLSTLLIHCAEAVSMDDRATAAQLLAKIKQQSSPTGDASQRLAFCFAEGLEARLAGTGSTLYTSLVAKRTPFMEFLKAYQLYLVISCFKMTAYRFSNMTISKAVAGKK